MSDKPSILIADNEPGITGLLSMEFESAGYQPIIVKTPEETRKEFIKLWNQDAPPKIALIDVALGDETGWEIVKFIRKYDRDCLVFLFTGHKNPIVDKLQIRKTGANGIIYKPKDGSEVLAQIKLYEKERDRKANPAGQSGFLVIQTAKEAAFIMAFLVAVGLNIWFVARMDAQLSFLTHKVEIVEQNIMAEAGTRSMSFNALDGSIKEVKGAVGQINKGK